MAENTHNIDELLIKISGRVAIGRKLRLGEDVVIRLTGQCVKEEAMDNQDGTVNICYVIKGIEAEL